MIKKLLPIIMFWTFTYANAQTFDVELTATPICSGNPGSVSTIITGTGSTFTFSWTGPNSFTATSQDISNLTTAGEYSLEVTRTANPNDRAKVVKSVEINKSTNNLKLEIVPSGTVNILCNGETNGAISVLATEGTSPYLFAIKASVDMEFTEYSSNNGLFRSLNPGTYDVAVRDALGCESTVNNITLTEPGTISMNSEITHTSCTLGNDNGNIEIQSVVGGSGVYTFEWTNGAGTVIGTTQDIANLATDNYTLKITDDNDCQVTFDFTIYEGFELEGFTTDVACREAKNGSIELNIIVDDVTDLTTALTDGSMTIRWKQGTTDLSEFNNDLIVNGLGPGEYSATVDYVTRSCSKTTNFTIQEPTSVIVDNTVLTHVNCKGDTSGAIEVNGTGGASNLYLYSISGDATIDDQSESTFSNLAAGNYSVTIKDENGCVTAPSAVTIQEPITGVTLDNVATTDVSCSGVKNGTARLDVTKTGSPNLLIRWYDESNDLFNDTNTDELLDLAGGSYRVEVEVSEGALTCVRELNFSIFEPSEFTLDITPTSLSCPTGVSGEDGKIFIEPVGGTGPYDFLLRQGSAAVLPILQDQTNASYDISVAGTYSVEVTDANGCQAESGDINISIPENISATVSNVVNVACNGESSGSIEIEITGGTPNYGYSWTNSASSTVAIVQNVTNIPADTYKLNLIDANNCSYNDVLEVTITEPTTTFSIDATVNEVTCNGFSDGSIDVTLNLGSHPSSFIEYLWSKSGDTDFTSNAQDINNLTPGSYSITVTDSLKCSKSATYDVLERTVISLNSSTTKNLCHGDNTGSISISPSGSSGTYNIKWFEGTTELVAEADKTAISGLSPGVFKVELTDDIGCEVEESFTITQPEELSAKATVSNVKCKGINDASIVIEVSGGTEPYNIFWQKDGVFYANDINISNLNPGTYTLTVEDGNNCTPLIKDYIVTEPSTSYSLDGTISNIVCHDAFDASINLNIIADSGHPSDYTIVWTKDDNAFVNDLTTITNLGTGTYKADVTDANGCQNFITFEISNPEQIIFNPALVTISCNGSSDGSISVTPTGGYGGYSINWYNSNETLISTNFQITNLLTDIYKAEITDANDCKIDTLITLSEPVPILVTDVIQNVTCLGGSNGSIEINASSGVDPYTYEWKLNNSIFSTSNALSNLLPGAYNLVVTDANDCKTIAKDYIITEPATTFELDGNISSMTCTDQNNASIDLIINGVGHPAEYEFNWTKNGTQFAQSTEDLSGLGEGIYEVTVIDINNCQKTRSFQILNPEPIVITEELTHPLCAGDNNGRIGLIVTGGIGAFTFSWEKDGVPLSEVSSFLTSLTVGNYTVKAQDAQGCIKESSYRLTQPQAIVPTLTHNSNTCSEPFDAQITVSVIGGVLPYSYVWEQDGSFYSQDADIFTLSPALYKLTVIDANLCESTPIEVNITSPERLSLNILTFEDTKCNNTADGLLSFQGKGGTAPYTYSFNDQSFSSENTITNLGEGTYNLSVLDARNCRLDTAINMTVQFPLFADFALEADAFSIDFPILFKDASVGDEITKWFWDFDDNRASETQSPTITYYKPGMYLINLRVENNQGCFSTKTFDLAIDQGFKFVVPDAFTPNNDGLNDFFRPVFENILNIEMIIKDRYGQTVFETKKLDEFWNGRYKGQKSQDGAYYYEIKYQAKSGIIRKDKGKLLLFR